ncbi:MAG: threonine/serine exporter family protein, partial [Treponemataceae bacterium]|nr:threonine/serine exporter family protein [Treponemataceae bacterium]
MKTEVSSDNITDISMRAGELMLQNGGETYRTEELVVHTANALGAKESSSFVTPTVVISSFVDKENHHHSAIRRVQDRHVNLRKLSQVNMLSRRLMLQKRKTNPDLIESILARISASPDYSPLIMIFAAAASSFCFAFVFGGGIKEAVAAFFIGLVLRIFLMWFETLPINSFISSICSGALIAVLSGAVVKYNF